MDSGGTFTKSELSTRARALINSKIKQFSKDKRRVVTGRLRGWAIQVDGNRLKLKVTYDIVGGVTITRREGIVVLMRLK